MLHQNGPWSTENGLLVHKASGVCVQPYDMAVGFGDGVVHKCGNAEVVNSYMDTFYKRISSIMPFDPPEIIIIYFNNFEHLSPDDICTLSNYLLNCIPIEQVKTLLELTPEELTEKIQKLQSFGF